MAATARSIGPGGYFYRELMDFYPEAKVLLSVRDRSRRGSAASARRSGHVLRGVADAPARSARAEVDPRWRRYLALVDRMFWGERGTFADGHSSPGS